MLDAIKTTPKPEWLNAVKAHFCLVCEAPLARQAAFYVVTGDPRAFHLVVLPFSRASEASPWPFAAGRGSD